MLSRILRDKGIDSHLEEVRSKVLTDRSNVVNVVVNQLDKVENKFLVWDSHRRAKLLKRIDEEALLSKEHWKELFQHYHRGNISPSFTVFKLKGTAELKFLLRKILEACEEERSELNPMKEQDTRYFVVVLWDFLDILNNLYYMTEFDLIRGGHTSVVIGLFDVLFGVDLSKAKIMN